MKKQKLLLLLVMTMVAMAAISANAYVLVYEPFDYPDAALNGQGGAIGTTGTWTTYDKGFAEGWWCHPEGELSGVFVGATAPNIFDGTVANLPTAGGFVGMAGPEDRGLAAGTDAGTGDLDASIALDPSVTATFTSGTTTWFSYVGAHAWDWNQGSPTFMICTDPTKKATRGLTMQNSGNGIGGVGGPPRSNLSDVYPHYFKDGVHNQTPGGYLGGVFGEHDGTVPSFCSTGTCDGVLDESGQPRTQTMAWQVSDDDGFGAANIIVGKIEWDADTNGEDIITVVRFLETDEISEAAFDAQIALLPALSSRNWASNKPNLDQSQFDTLNISSTKFFVDELRIGTTFIDAQGFGKPKMNPSPANKSTIMPGDIKLSWENIEQDPTDTNDLTVVVLFGTDPNKTEGDMAELVLDPVSGLDVTSVIREGLTDGIYYWQVNTTFGTDPCVIEGPMWEFYIISDVAPSVDIVTAGFADSDLMTWTGESIDLVTEVEDDGVSPLTYAWIAEAPEGVTVDFDPGTDGSAATVTLTKVATFVPFAVNGSFEDPALEDKTSTTTSSVASWGTQWSASGSGTWATDNSPNGGAWDPNDTGDFSGVLPEGENVGYVDTDGNEHGLYQELTALVEASAQYDLSVKVGNPSKYNAGTTNDYRIELVVGGGVVASAPGVSPADDQSWITAEVSYVGADPNVGQPIAIRLVSTAAAAKRLCFDDVTLSINGESGEMVYDAEMSTVTITVAVIDEGDPAGDTDYIMIDVYDSACLMARFGEGKAADNLGDLNGDCDTNLLDLALIAEKWLNDIRLETPQHN